MKKHLLIRALFVALLAAVALIPSQAVLADSGCTAFLAGKTRLAFGQSYHVQLTVHRETVPLVSYSEGWLAPNGDGSFYGYGDQLFSDRLAVSQPFNVNAADRLDWYLSPSGTLRIHYHPWEFETTWDLSCTTGTLLTKYVSGFGLVTLTFRDRFSPNY